MTPEEAIAYLIDCDLLAPHDIVRGEVRVSDSSARNSALSVRRTTQSGLFLKQLASVAPGIGSAEGEFYAQVTAGGSLSTLGQWMPAMRRYDATSAVLVLELVHDALTARDAALGHARDSALPDIAGAAAPLGAALATCHAIARETDDPLREGLSHMVPFAFQLGFPSPRILRHVCPLQLDMLTLLQRQDGLPDCARARQQGWTFESLTHGDVRWTNLLIVPPSPDGGSASVRLIDWEHAGIGDPAWDVACALHSWLVHAIETLQLSEHDDPGSASVMFLKVLQPLQLQMGVFWSAYVARLDGDRASAEAILARALGYIPVRLLQTAWEWASDRPRMTPFILLTIQLAVNLLRRPVKATASLVGIGV